MAGAGGDVGVLNEALSFIAPFIQNDLLRNQDVAIVF